MTGKPNGFGIGFLTGGRFERVCEQKLPRYHAAFMGSWWDRQASWTITQSPSGHQMSLWDSQDHPKYMAAAGDHDPGNAGTFRFTSPKGSQWIATKQKQTTLKKHQVAVNIMVLPRLFLSTNFLGLFGGSRYRWSNVMVLLNTSCLHPVFSFRKGSFVWTCTVENKSKHPPVYIYIYRHIYIYQVPSNYCMVLPRLGKKTWFSNTPRSSI